MAFTNISDPAPTRLWRRRDAVQALERHEQAESFFDLYLNLNLTLKSGQPRQRVDQLQGSGGLPE